MVSPSRARSYRIRYCSVNVSFVDHWSNEFLIRSGIACPSLMNQARGKSFARAPLPDFIPRVPNTDWNGSGYGTGFRKVTILVGKN